MNRHIIITLLLIVFTIDSYSQQNPLYSQFTFNRFLFNPAVAGSENLTMLKLSAYEQWVGFKNAPKFHCITFDSRIFQDTRKPRRNVRRKYSINKPGTIGIGVKIFNEIYGPLSNTGIDATYAYHMKLGNNQLSFGLSSIVSHFRLNSSDVTLSDDEYDQLIQGNPNKRWVADFNFGVYTIAESYFAGYSIQHLSQSVLQWGATSEAEFEIGRVHYLMGGYKYNLNLNVAIEPSMLIKLAEKGRSQMDISVQTRFKRDYWAGLAYKTGSAISIFGGLNVTRYYFGYSFDYNLSEIRRFSYGSHEIMLAVQLGDTAKRYRWLNRY
ncbi:MAG: PorP/SprF family type IX secretion system membrane protein [Bacteroidales bacterium]|nr:PorP/SprF family type IX secretion system membrane protein [Bacteroidales bacterium]